jgi:hypothetical protein
MARELYEIARHIGCEPSCIIDYLGPGEIVRHARPMTAEDCTLGA